ncbi:hypothetical protein [Paraburkholderia bannensis]|uniref:hypothetical protein n=1 Tax=Paraburkholderia bannensis TaxID=765414 RepID=UPI002AB5E57A|nr:hypothetical protein [Paraburkholderia bannensis]
MQVTSSTSTAAMPASTPVTASAGKQPDNNANKQPESSTKVTLSDEGLQKSAQSDAANSTDAPDATGTKDPADSAGTTDTASSLKSVTYGVLGLPDPTKPQPTDNKAFGLGKGIAAIGTVVSVVMLALKFL